VHACIETRKLISDGPHSISAYKPANFTPQWLQKADKLIFESAVWESESCWVSNVLENSWL
jgi:hypothetical protein